MEAAQQLAAAQDQLRIEYVVTSPFLRCLQTSAEVVAKLMLPQGRWLVDFGMGEIGEPRLLMPSRPELERKVLGQPIDTWMWGSTSGGDALRRFMSLESDISRPGITPQLLNRPCAAFPESHESAMGRYRDELEWILDGGLLKGNVLVVTHGEAVRAAVNMHSRDATVYEVKHCAFVRLERGAAGAGAQADAGHGDELMFGEEDELLSIMPPKPQSGQSKAGGWRLACSSGETGVSWFS